MPTLPAEAATDDGATVLHGAFLRGRARQTCRGEERAREGLVELGLLAQPDRPQEFHAGGVEDAVQRPVPFAHFLYPGGRLIGVAQVMDASHMAVARP
jgi:hypothetical protein